MGVEKVSRQAIILLREEHPEFTLREIGEEAPKRGGWGEPVTRQRVQQILATAKKPTQGSAFRHSMRRSRFKKELVKT